VNLEKLPLVDGHWRYSRPPGQSDPSQGWKIHVSATVLSAAEVLRRVHPILHKCDAFYKVPSRPELLASLNSGLPDFSQVGKFLTVYARSIDEATNLARELHKVTRGLPGPRVPFDAPYRKKSLVYYRYGAFRSWRKSHNGVIRGPRGERIPDVRAPGRAVPSWLEDPFNKGARIRTLPKGPIGLELLAYKARARRGKGGVYQALDLSVSPPRLVIIKEGRRHGETDWNGTDGYSRIKHEGQVLRALQRAGVPVPKVLRDFDQNGNRYLVLERITSRLLIPVGRTQPKQFSWRRAEKILDPLTSVLSLVHAAGWVWRDCKPAHIFLRRGLVRLIDFEGACRRDHTRVPPWSSPDYTPPIYERSLVRRSGTLEDDYALGVIAFQFLSGKFPPGNFRRRAAIYKSTRCPDSLRSRIESLLRV
jgi:hypothetical protein